MKKVKKLFAVLLAAMTVMALSATALAVNNGSITINNAHDGETYSAYLIFELESYDPDTGAYAYKLPEKSDWTTFVNNKETGGKYVSVDDAGYVTWKYKYDESATDNDKAAIHAEFAKLALIYAENNDLTPSSSSEAASGGSATISDLPLGYYLVDSSLGSLAILDTVTNPATLSDKHLVPDVEKKVKNGETWDASNTASIGDTVEFQTTITAKKIAKNYVLHDKMTDGLTLEAESINITYQKVQEDGTLSTTKTPMTKDTNYTLATEDLDDGCTFHVTFNNTFLADLDTGDVITVTYSATLNENAQVDAAGDTNETHLTYGNGTETTKSTTTTNTYFFDLVKTNKDGKIISGAEFQLYEGTDTENAQPISLVAVEGGYRVAKNDVKGEDETTTTIQAGKVRISGLGNGTYTLVETKQPDGYNKLKDPQTVTINSQNQENETAEGANVSKNDGGIQVVNLTGTELPETGGIGTTIFYVLGGVLMVGAVVLLVTRKRMRDAE